MYLGEVEHVATTSHQEALDRDIAEAIERCSDLLDSNGDLLDDRELAIIEMRFGIGTSEPLSVDDVADNLKTDRADIRFTEQRVMQKLRGAKRSA